MVGGGNDLGEGDVVLEAAGQDVRKASLARVTELCSGPVGSTVRLVVSRREGGRAVVLCVRGAGAGLKQGWEEAVDAMEGMRIECARARAKMEEEARY